MIDKRLGVFGGSFDPVHVGHLIIGEILRHDLQLDTVLFLPAGRPPHKPEQELAADHHRVEMLELALSDAPGFEISMLDLDRPGSSYTATTLEILRDELAPGAELFFLMGQDSLRDFPRWRDPDRIAQLATLAVALRPGVEVDVQDIIGAVPETEGRIQLVSVPLIGVSSRDVRRRIRAGESFRFQVPNLVANYIARHGLYTHSGTDETATPVI
jgi:nicotinate-nucleotide adenylyltransferase